MVTDKRLRAKAHTLPHSHSLPLRFSLYLKPLCSRNSSLRRPSPATSWSGWWAYWSLQAARSERGGSDREKGQPKRKGRYKPTETPASCREAAESQEGAQDYTATRALQSHVQLGDNIFFLRPCFPLHQRSSCPTGAHLQTCLCLKTLIQSRP